MKRISKCIAHLTVASAFMLSIAATPGLAQQPAKAAATPMKMTKSTNPTGPLTKVNGRMVCMVTNKSFNKPQMPVRVKGRTYYGCCSMCKNMLRTDASNRVAIDPISKKKIDKSKAVIGAGSNDAVVYFQNQADLQKYNAEHAH